MNTMKYPEGSISGKMNGRMYDPVVSRFISPDPFIQSPSQSESFNRYSYCMNNPMRFTDPSGYYAAPSDRPLKMSMQEIQEKIQRERSEWMQELDQAYGRGYGGTSGMSSNSNITIYSGGLPVLSGVVGEIGAGLLKSYTDISGIGVEFNQRTGEIMMHTTHVYSVGEWVKLGDKYWELNTTVVENVTRSLADVLGNMNNKQEDNEDKLADKTQHGDNNQAHNIAYGVMVLGHGNALINVASKNEIKVIFNATKRIGTAGAVASGVTSYYSYKLNTDHSLGDKSALGVSWTSSALCAIPNQYTVGIGLTLGILNDLGYLNGIYSYLDEIE